KKDIVQPIVESPTQGEKSLLAGDKLGDDGSVPRDGHVNRRVGLVLYVDDLAAVFEITPTLRGQILSLVVDCFNVEVLDGWPDVGESPTDALVVSDNHKGQAGQTHAGHIEIAAAQVHFVPEIWHLVVQVHIVRQQRLSCDGMRSGDDPVIRSGARRP